MIRGWVVTDTESTGTCGHVSSPYLDAVLDFAGVVADNEGGLHDGGELDVAVPLMLPFELVQQGLVRGLGETKGTEKRVGTRVRTVGWETRVSTGSKWFQITPLTKTSSLKATPHHSLKQAPLKQHYSLKQAPLK